MIRAPLKISILNCFRSSLSAALLIAVILFPWIAAGLSVAIAQTPESKGAVNLQSVNWSGNDYAPIISPDGRFLIFQSDRPSSFEGNNLWFVFNKSYMSNKTGGAEWTQPLPLRFPFLETATDTMRITHPPGTLEEPKGAFTVNTDGFEGMASVLFRNGSPVEIYFTSLRGSGGDREGYHGLNIYFSRFRDSRWSVPTHLNDINSHFDDRMPAISQDGKHLYFSSNRPGGYGGYDIWYTLRNLETGLWSEPVNAGENINTAYNEISPTLMPEGTLFFSSDRPGGFGHYDLFVSKYGEGGRGKAENLGYPFNSPRDDEYLSVTEDSLWGYFSSDRSDPDGAGEMDLYRIYLPGFLHERVSILFTGLILDGASRDPLGIEATLHIDYEKETIVINSSRFQKSPDMAEKSNFSVQLSSGRVYRVRISAPGYHPASLTLDYTGGIPPARTDRRIILLQPAIKAERERRILPGRVIDDATGLSLPGSFVEYESKTMKSQSVAVDREGAFNIGVEKGGAFTVTGRAPGYEIFRKDFVESATLKDLVIRLKKSGGDLVCPGDAPECIDNLRIYFDLNSAEIRPDQIKTMDAIVRILKKNPSIKIEIQGHTDKSYRGQPKQAFEYNKRLSEMRARRIKETLEKMGVGTTNLTLRGYSYLQPLGEEINPESRALNRRVEFRRILDAKD
jgi:peptidoglycan-associated lipoprotein